MLQLHHLKDKGNDVYGNNGKDDLHSLTATEVSQEKNDKFRVANYQFRAHRVSQKTTEQHLKRASSPATRELATCAKNQA